LSICRVETQPVEEIMPCLILYAHGSRDPNWRRPFEALEDDLQKELGTGRVRLAFMEFAAPGLVDVVGAAVRDGIGQYRLLPLFLAGGAHVAIDIPQQVGEVLDRFPDVEIEVLPPIGEDSRVVTLMRDIARELAAVGCDPGFPAASNDLHPVGCNRNAD
jgi:sirohydrochlorin cobaltochelatase